MLQADSVIFCQIALYFAPNRLKSKLPYVSNEHKCTYRFTLLGNVILTVLSPYADLLSLVLKELFFFFFLNDFILLF